MDRPSHLPFSYPPPRYDPPDPYTPPSSRNPAHPHEVPDETYAEPSSHASISGRDAHHTARLRHDRLGFGHADSSPTDAELYNSSLGLSLRPANNHTPSHDTPRHQSAGVGCQVVRSYQRGKPPGRHFAPMHFRPPVTQLVALNLPPLPPIEDRICAQVVEEAAVYERDVGPNIQELALLGDAVIKTALVTIMQDLSSDSHGGRQASVISTLQSNNLFSYLSIAYQLVPPTHPKHQHFIQKHFADVFEAYIGALERCKYHNLDKLLRSIFSPDTLPALAWWEDHVPADARAVTHLVPIESSRPVVSVPLHLPYDANARPGPAAYTSASSKKQYHLPNSKGSVVGGKDKDAGRKRSSISTVGKGKNVMESASAARRLAAVVRSHHWEPASSQAQAQAQPGHGLDRDPLLQSDHQDYRCRQKQRSATTDYPSPADMRAGLVRAGPHHQSPRRGHFTPEEQTSQASRVSAVHSSQSAISSGRHLRNVDSWAAGETTGTASWRGPAEQTRPQVDEAALWAGLHTGTAQEQLYAASTLAAIIEARKRRRRRPPSPARSDDSTTAVVNDCSCRPRR